MQPATSPDLEVLFRVCAATHGAFRLANGSPHRADIVAMGADGSPTEEIDRIAEAQVLAALEAEHVDWNLMSEEIGAVHRGGRRTLVLDPIDGSHNVLRRLPYATVSLTITNTSASGSAYVTSVTGSATTTPAGCVNGWFAVSADPIATNLAPGASVTINGYVSLTESGTNQNACAGSTPTITWTAS